MLSTVVDRAISIVQRKSQAKEWRVDTGYYDLPIRVNDYVLEENSESQIVWLTTCCEGNPERLRVLQDEEDGGWYLNKVHKPFYGTFVKSLDCSEAGWSGELQRKRALWHAKQIMEGRLLSPPERGITDYHLDPPEIEDVDLFFQQPTDVRENPLGEYLLDRTLE